MTLTLILLATLMAVFSGWLIRQSIADTPWVAASGHVVPLRSVPAGVTAPRVALGVFLAVVTSVFALTISAYMMRMAASAEWRFLPHPQLAWVNTGLLVIGSLGLQIAWTSVKRERPGAFWRDAFWLALALGVGCTVAFMAGQYLLWRELMAAGYYMTDYVGSAFFLMMSFLHGAHLLGGLVVLTRAVVAFRRGAPLSRLRESIALCAVYWHYLLFVWIVLYSVLFVGAVPLYGWCRG
ncbi:MAG: hypothetical protein WC809_07585 [Sinimarinibacterium sp.]